LKNFETPKLFRHTLLVFGYHPAGLNAQTTRCFHLAIRLGGLEDAHDARN
jgi:hypothetical protein